MNRPSVGCRTWSIPPRNDPARDALFRHLLDHPPFPPGSSLKEQREILDGLVSMNPAVPVEVDVRQVVLPTGAAAEHLAPPGADKKQAIVYAHGGAFVNGRTPGVWRYPAYRIAAAANASLLYVLH